MQQKHNFPKLGREGPPDFCLSIIIVYAGAELQVLQWSGAVVGPSGIVYDVHFGSRDGPGR